MKVLARLTAGILFFAWSALPSPAAFSSLYVFGDGICSTTNGPGTGPYYGNRYCNGRVWLEVLAQWQGITYESNKNWSFYGHYSSNMVINVNQFTAPADAGTALFVVWACDADFVWNVQNYGAILADWTNSINRSLANHFKIITNLYHAKGARTLIMPNAVDTTKVPFFQQYQTSKAFVRQRTIEFNGRFAALLSSARQSLPGLSIYSPDVFTLLDDVAVNPTHYGLIKPETCAIYDLPPSQWALDGPGTNYVFWDDFDPTARFHMVVADTVQCLLSPVNFTGITSFNGSNRLDVVNVPIGRHGFVEGSTDLLNWSFAQNVNPNFAAQSVFVPASPDPQRFYRLRFPFAWTWP